MKSMKAVEEENRKMCNLPKLMGPQEVANAKPKDIYNDIVF